MKRIKNNPNESFLDMLDRLDKEDHGNMTKEEYDAMKDKWMQVYWEIKHREKNPLLLSYEDIQRMYQ